MAITINTNVASLNAQRYLNQTQDRLTTNLQKLSSGYKINSAKDDAAGLAISEGMKSQILGLKAGVSNGNNGISLIGTAEAGMTQLLTNSQRMYELAIQASNGTNQASDRAKLDQEFQSLKDENDRIAATANFNGVNVLTAGTVTVQIGSENSANDRLSITLVAADTTSLGINGDDLTSEATAQTAIDNLKLAIASIASGLSGLGASHSNIEAGVRGNTERVTKLEEARSRIVDVDFAEESSNLAKNQILQQAGMAMLSQANSSSQSILKLIS